MVLCVSALFSREARADESAAPFARIEIPGIENAFDLGAGVFSGGAPEGEAAFAELARRGVKTIVSVDGARPDVEAARRAGLRYVHLPVGYDGVPQAQALALAQLAVVERGPIFVHCHHGKHRGPAAAAIVCAMREGWSGARGEAWLQAAGTSADYPGLYRSVREFRPLSAEAVTAAPVTFREVAPTPPRVEAMVAIDERFDALKAARSRGWAEPAAEGAVLLREQFRELARAEVDPQLRGLFEEAERAAAGLGDSLRKKGAVGEREAAWSRVAESCADCHREHRNVRVR